VLALALIACAAALPNAAPAQDPDPAAEAVRLFNEGQDAHERGELRTAIDLYRRALRLLPELAEAEYQLATAHLALSETEAAESAFRRAVELRDDWTLPMTGLGALLVGAGRFDEAAALLERAISIDRQNSAAYSALTELKLRNNAGRPELVTLLETMRALTGGSKPTAQAWAARASLERTLGDLGAAKVSVAKALAIEPGSRASLSEMIEIAIASDDPATAVAAARQLAKAAPAADSAKFLLARALASAGETGEALTVLESISIKSPEIAGFRSRLESMTSENPAELEKRLSEAPADGAVLGRLCSLYRVSAPEKALVFCRRASEAEPGNLNHVIGFGAALVQAKQYENAAALLRKIAESAPENYTVRANLAVALFQLRRYPEAKAEYRWLIEKQPSNAVAYYFLAIIHDQLKEYLDAMANYQQFLRLAEPERNRLEIEKVNLRLPSLRKQLKEKN
jgi:tetratricopeptide (TPR) repeat protein